MIKGIFCISIDTELLWGRWDKNYQPFIWRTKKERAIIAKLLSLFKRYDVPVTWAIVANLFLTQKNKDNQLWSGQDIIKMIQDSKIHELASHSLSHSEFDKAKKAQAEREIKESVAIAKKNGIKFYSFVFPRNKIGHLEILKKYGFKAFRGPDKRAWELLLPVAPPVYKPSLTHSLVNIPASLYLVSARGIRKFIPPHLRVIKAKLGINRAIKETGIFHLWFHPVDLVDNEKEMFWALEQIITFAKQKEKGGKLEIKTMAQIARGVLP